MRALLIAAVLLLPHARAVVLDRIAAVVNNRVIKDSDIDREIRVTSFINGEKLEFTPAARRKAANRLIDQAIIRREIELGRYPEATEQETDQLLKSTLQAHPNVKAYGLTVDQLKRALRWQLTVLRFIDQRFRPRPVGDQPDPFIGWLDEARKTTPVKYHEEELK